MSAHVGHCVIRGGRVLDIGRHAAEVADILVEGDTIREIGPAGLATPTGALVIDAADRLLVPGLVNAHTHGHGHLGKGSGDRWTLELLLNAGPGLNSHRTLEDKYLACLLGGLDMIRSGTTACYDLFHEFPLPSFEGLEAAARGYRDAGLRVVLAPMVADHNFYEAIDGLLDALSPAQRKAVERFRLAPAAETLAALEAIIARWPFDPTEAGLALAPTIPLHCSDDFLTGCSSLAREAGLGLHMHLAESKVQAITGMKRYGRTLTAHIETLGVLGPHFTAAHAVWLDDDDISRLADHGATVAHNPGSNLRLGSGIAPARRMRERGLAVGIGTDGSQCSDNQNMFEATRLASFSSRITSPDPDRWLSTDEALTMATQNSARALGLGSHIGRIAPGLKADIVFLDLGNLNYVPLNDPTNQVVLAENGAAVDSVMIGGRMVLDRGRFTTFEVERLRHRVNERVTVLREQNRELAALAFGLEKVVSHFCVGLTRSHYHVERFVPG
jgi:5-methylthioadenosine/S-adenosylhomocysteine deaminase